MGFVKRFLSYTNPEGKFSEENQTLVKVQIDNSYDLGWKKEDILLFTNFPYEYNGVKAIQIPCLDISWDRTSNKIPVIAELLKRNLLDHDLYFYSDFDAYENVSVQDVPMDGYDIGLTSYGYKPQVNGGSFFFRDTTVDFFTHWDRRLRMINRTRADEKTMTDMTRNGELDPWDWKLLDISYNFGQRGPKLCYEQAEKPLKVLHFHPYYRFYPKDDTNINVFMHGHNRHKIPMMTDRLAAVFKHNGVS